MKLTLDALIVLDAIHRQGSFAAAAETLHRVPSAITYSMKKLEQDLNTPLFNRAGHRAKLTESGKFLLDEGRHLLEAVSELENQVKKVSRGWEIELNIAIADMLPIEGLLELINEFYQQQSGTRIRLHSEVYGGTWDALMSNRADLVIGAPDNGPTGGGYHVRKLCQIDWIFVIAADHPLAKIQTPIPEDIISKYRVIAVADTSRNLPPRTAGIYSGQDIFTVPNFKTKIKAHIMGMGVGFLPRYFVQNEIEQGLLIEKEVETGHQTATSYLAWRTGKTGRSLQWFIDKLDSSLFCGNHK
ncbi:MAG: LysR family transcriptional regulator [endosymbiont of Galathealinum brachiosum]|uniref:LysR family transcriptional regulator n=1 Tax=endosymbiont of Galathealinum brachiosum TaxID=2200906 RepID=A0A370DCV9_9GAMM|nr:MAG: LysR family transcriptional regulator [endosymbiont of Galathealinum brachiosum]